jgi:zinc finger protein
LDPRLVWEENNVCPSCRNRTFNIKIYYYEIPQGPLNLIVSKCSSCGFSFRDVVPLWEGEGKRIELKVENMEDLSSKVFRGPNGRVLIPELGVEIEPGPYSQGYLGTVDGIIEDILEITQRECEGRGDDGCRKAIERIEKALRGELNFTLIIEDHTGLSFIISKKARVEVIKKEEN